jgi:exosortase F-associated protein
MKRSGWIGGALLVLVLVFVFQRFNYAVVLTSFLPEGLQITQPNTIFMVNKTIRLVLNDVACMVLIYAWFKERKYLTLSFYLFLVEVGLLLPIYFIVKLSLEGDSEISSPLLSQIHRLIVNPLLMFLLMVGFIYQRVRIKNA